MRPITFPARHSMNRLFSFSLVLFILLPGASTVLAQTWLSTPASGNWNTTANWDTNSVPDTTSATATFGLSGTTVISNTITDITLSGIQFNSGASSYTLDNNNGQFLFQGAGIVDLSGQTQQINNEGNLTFQNSSTAGDLLVTGSGSVTFTNSATAGTAIFSSQGILDFNTNATAGNSSITTSNTGNIIFQDNSTAGFSTIVNNGTVSFGDSATGGKGTITNNGSLFFAGTSNPVSAVIANNANLAFESSATAGESSIGNSSTGSLNFNGSANAGGASITNGGYIAFNNNSSAVSAVIINNSVLQFNDSASADNAQISNTGHLIFTGLSMAGSATITTNNGGNMSLSQGAQGGTATFITTGTGVFDDSGVTTGGVTVGSIQGTGTYDLGANELATGANNLSTTVSGLLVDGGAGGGTGGSLSKIGTGTLTLSGNNTYSGGTTIAQGTLAVDTGGALGTGIAINNATLNFIHNATAGSVTIINNADLNFFNLSTAGSAIISNTTGASLTLFGGSSAGSATISNAFAAGLAFSSNSTAGNSDIANAGNLSFFENATAGSAVISNAAGASLVFAGSSTAGNSDIINTGSLNFFENTTAGTAMVSNAAGASLIFYASSNAAGANITNNGTLNFNEDSTAGNSEITTNPGAEINFSENAHGGTAQLIFGGTGVLDISGIASSVTVGSLSGTGSYFLGSKGLVVGANSLSTTVLGVLQDGGMSGGTGGSLTKIGTGTLTLLGGNSYTGETTVAEGALALGGAGLSLNGSLALNGGTLETSGGPSTILIKSNYLQSSGGTLLLALDNGQQDAISVGGNALVGGALALDYGNGFQLNSGNSVTILSAGVVSGLFNQWNNPVWGRLFPVYGSTQVSLESVLPTFQISGLTPNEKAVAGALDNSFEDPAHYALISNLVGQSNANLPGIYGQIDPSGLASLYQMNFIFSRTQASLVDQRLEAAALEGDDSSFASRQGDIRFAGNLPASQEQAVAQNLSHPGQWGSFVSGSGDFGNLSGDGNANGYHFTVNGLTAGADYGFGADLTGGVLLGFAQGTATNMGGGEVDFSGGQLGLYSGWRNAGIHTEVLVEGGLNSIKYQQAGFGGTASANPTGQQYSGNLDLGYDFKFEKWKVGPFASMQYSHANWGAFNEAGSNAPLVFPSQGEGSLMSDIGTYFTQDLKWGSTTWSPRFSAAWEHVYEGEKDSLSANLGSAAESFAVSGPATGQNALVIGIGLEAAFKEGPAFFARYQGKVGMTNYTEQNLAGGVQFGF